MRTLYLRPIPSTDPALRYDTFTLAGGWARFEEVEILQRGQAPCRVLARDLDPAALRPFLALRAPIAGLDLGQPRLMGIVNVTPDSFSDGGRHGSTQAAVDRAQEMYAEGADLVDLGGESTRPGATDLTDAEEMARVIPVLEGLRAARFPLPLSLDTRKSSVARAGLDVGARIVNDVSGLRFDPAIAAVAARAEVPLILMHSIGTPQTMQALAPDAYTDVLLDAYDTLEAAVAQAEAAGVPRARIMVDPGIGFGKTLEQNLALLQRVSLFHGLGCAILVGASRKGMIGKISGETDAGARGPGSAALGLWAVSQGIQMLRVHDISLHKQALALWQAVAGGAAA